jgi:glucokinase
MESPLIDKGHNSLSTVLQPWHVGVDVGGTKIAAGVVDTNGGIRVIYRRSTDTSSPQASLSSIAEAVEQAITESAIPRQHILGVGLGIPGLVDADKGIGIASVNLNWQNVPVKAALEGILGLPCAIENDVRAAALGEVRFGAGRGLENILYLSIGTGIAISIIQDGKIFHGLNGMAGEIGHAVIERDGPLCKCGGRGCFEAMAAGPAIARRAWSKIQAGRASMLVNPNRADALTCEEVFQAAGLGDSLACETLQEVGKDIAFVLQFLFLFYEPQLIVLGGGVSLAGQLFLDPIIKSLEQQAAESWVLAKVFKPQMIQLTTLGRDIGILGAAALCTPPR